MTMTVKALTSENEFSYKKDYLNVCGNFKVIESLIEYGDSDPRGVCLSDDIYIFNSKMKRKRRRLVVTEKSLFLFSKENMKNGSWKMLRKYPLRDLRQVVISSQNYTLAAFVFIKGPDFMIDSCRRIDIVIYIAQMMRRAQLNLFRILFLKTFNMKANMNNDIMGKQLTSSFHESQTRKSKGNKTRSTTDFSAIGDEERDKQLPILQETFRNAKMSGFLKLRKVTKKWFSVKKTFKEYFFILTNVGLVYFKNYGVSKNELN